MNHLVRLVVLLGIFSQSFASDVIYENQQVELRFPHCSLAEQALEITTPKDFFTDWSEKQHREAYRIQRTIALIWKEKGLINYLSLGKNSFEDSSKPFNWQIIPFPDESIAIIKQIKIIKNVIFDTDCLSKQQSEHAQLIQDFTKEIAQIPAADDSEKKSDDPFCQDEVIANQIVFEGQYVNVLYNYAPIVDLSFLIVTKAHRPTFLELTEDEYTEAQMLTALLLKYFYSQGYSTAYIYHKTGKRAGQNVPHWHQHISIPDHSQSNIKNMLKAMQYAIFGGSSPLDSKELSKRVKFYKNELNDTLKK